MLARFRRVYGATPLHLLGLLASLLIAGAGVVGWFDSFQGPDVVRILVWVLGAALAHDLILLPLYTLLDRIAFGTRHNRRAATPPRGAGGWTYVRVPALLSGLLVLVFFPEAFQLGNATFRAASGFSQEVYLARLLATCGALFALSGLAYAVALGRRRRRAALTAGTPDR